MAISKLVLEALRKKGIPFQTAHSRKLVIRKKVNNAISSEVALDIVAANEGIDVHKLLTKDKRTQELADFKLAHSIPSLSNGKNKSRNQSKENDSDKKEKKGTAKTVAYSTTIDQVIGIGKKLGIENINQNWIDALVILNFIETASTKFLMDHGFSEERVKSMKWDQKLTQVESQLQIEASAKNYTIRTSSVAFFKNYRTVRNEQDHHAHLPSAKTTKEDVRLLRNNLQLFINVVFVEPSKH